MEVASRISKTETKSYVTYDLSIKPSFDRRTYKNRTVYQICMDLILSDLDGKMTSAYNSLLGKLPESEKSRLIRAQQDWIKTRNACSMDVMCLDQIYRDRIVDFVLRRP